MCGVASNTDRSGSHQPERPIAIDRPEAARCPLLPLALTLAPVNSDDCCGHLKRGSVCILCGDVVILNASAFTHGSDQLSSFSSRDAAALSAALPMANALRNSHAAAVVRAIAPCKKQSRLIIMFTCYIVLMCCGEKSGGGGTRKGKPVKALRSPQLYIILQEVSVKHLLIQV